MNKNKLLQKYDINTYINTKMKNHYREVESIRRYIKKNGEENLEHFAEAFWENASEKTANLKDKFNIPNNVGYSDILKAYPTEEYINFIKDYYINAMTKDELSKKYNLDNQKIGNLVIDFIIIIEDRYCRECFGNKYKVEFEENEVNLTCCECFSTMKYNDTYSKEEKEEKEKKIKEKIEKYNKKLEEIIDRLEEVKCPSCQNKLKLHKNKNFCDYIIHCEKCSYSHNDIEEVEREYGRWRHRAAMMIAIKSKEQELIEEKLKVKSKCNINFVNEDIISREFAYSKIEQFFNIAKTINGELGSTLSLKKLLKGCSRLERNLLIHIIKLLKEHGESFIVKDVPLMRFMFKEPLVITLIEETGIIVVRKLLKELINKYLIVADEENNIIIISEYLISKLNVIENCNEVQNIEPHLKYMTMSRQKFKCYTCGEDGKSLKIAYLTSNKNTMNLDEVVALCPDCFELYARNDIIIDGIVSFDVFKDELSNSMKFLLKYIPDLKGVNRIYDIVEELEDQYGVNNTIKALSIGLNAMKIKKLDKNIDSLIRYTRGVINNADLDLEGVMVYENVYHNYNLDEWGIDESSIITL